MSISRVRNLGDLINFFIPRSDVIYYRPVSLQLFYFIFHKIFGLNIIYYHLFQVFFHALNGIFVFLIAEKLFRNRKISFLASLLFVVSWTHFYELTWVASTFNSVGLMFILLYILSYFNEKLKKFFIPEIFLVMALLSVETAVCAPLLLVLLSIFISKKINIKSFRRLIPHFAIIFVYLLVRFVIAKVPATDSYSIGLSPLMMKNMVIFFLWLINFPEVISVHLTFRDFPLVSDWFAEKFPIYSIFISETLVFFVLFLIFVLIKNKKSLFNKTTLFGVLWFLIAISPIIVIPKRVYPYYPFVAQIGFWIVFASVISKNWKFLLTKMFFIYFLAANFYTVWFTNENHWIFSESYQSKFYMSDFLKQYPRVTQNGKNILIPVGMEQTRFALSHGKAFNLALNNYDVNFYLDEKDVPSSLEEATCTMQIPEQIIPQKLKSSPIYWRGVCLRIKFRSCFCPKEYRN